MDNSAYNSLTQKLIQNGIIAGDNIDSGNFFEIQSAEAVIEKTQEDKTNKKRINRYDLDLIEKEPITNTINFKTVALMKILRRFLNFRENKARKSGLKFENLLFKFFPKLYKAKLVKDAMRQLIELNIDAKTLLDKTIPYGENDSRYQDLIKYISCANEIQLSLKKKI